MEHIEKKTTPDNMASLWILLSLFAASIEPIIVKIGYKSNINPYELLIIKTLAAAIFIFPLTRTYKPVGWKGILKIGSVSVLLLINNLSSLMALKHISAVIYLTLITTTPAVIALINSYLGRENLSLKFWGGFVLAFTGVLVTLNISGNSFSTITAEGIIFILLSMVCTTIYRIRMENITEEFSPILVSTYIFWINAAMVLIFFLPWSGPLTTGGWKIGIWLGFAGAVANVAFLFALHILGSTRVSIFNMIQRPFIIIGAAVILQESVSIEQIAGIIITILGINMAKNKRIQKSPCKA